MDVTFANEMILVEKLFMKIGDFLVHPRDLTLGEEGVKVYGWITLNVQSDMDIAELTVIKHCCVMFLTVTFIDLEGNDGVSRFIPSTFGRESPSELYFIEHIKNRTASCGNHS